MEENKNGLYMMAIVAIVAVVGIVTMILFGAGTGTKYVSVSGTDSFRKAVDYEVSSEEYAAPTDRHQCVCTSNFVYWFDADTPCSNVVGCSDY